MCEKVSEQYKEGQQSIKNEKIVAVPVVDRLLRAPYPKRERKGPVRSCCRRAGGLLSAPTPRWRHPMATLQLTTRMRALTSGQNNTMLQHEDGQRNGWKTTSTAREGEREGEREAGTMSLTGIETEGDTEIKTESTKGIHNRTGRHRHGHKHEKKQARRCKAASIVMVSLAGTSNARHCCNCCN